MSTSPRSSLNRISFDTTKEWSIIRRDYTNLVNEELAKMPADLPDSDKAIIEQRVKQFLDQTFKYAEMNLRINGRNFEDLTESELNTDMEPFDEALNAQIYNLADSRHTCEEEVAENRRERPPKLETKLQKELAEHEQVLLQQVNEDPEPEEAYEPEPLLLLASLDREQQYENMVSLTQNLKQTIPVQVERVAQYKKSLVQIKNLRP